MILPIFMIIMLSITSLSTSMSFCYDDHDPENKHKDHDVGFLVLGHYGVSLPWQSSWFNEIDNYFIFFNVIPDLLIICKDKYKSFKHSECLMMMTMKIIEYSVLGKGDNMYDGIIWLAHPKAEPQGEL